MDHFGVAATTRASFYLYIVPEEVDRLVDGLRRVHDLVQRMTSGYDELYRELILDHYKNPRNHGLLEPADAEAEGQNPLCGDEVAISVAFGADGDTIETVALRGPRLRDQPGGDVDADGARRGPDAPPTVAAMPKDELLEEIGIPLTPGAAQVRAARARRPQGRAAPREGDAAARGVGGPGRAGAPVVVPDVVVGPVEELPPGAVKIVRAGELAVGVYNAGGELYAIEDRCSHDDGPLAEGDFEPEDVRW